MYYTVDHWVDECELYVSLIKCNNVWHVLHTGYRMCINYDNQKLFISLFFMYEIYTLSKGVIVF